MTKARDLSNLIGSSGQIDNTKITLDAAEIPSLDASKITTGTFDASKIGSGTFADARIASSSVSQHVTQYDDAKLKDGVAMLAFKLASTSSLGRFDLSNQTVDEFVNENGINTGSLLGEFLSGAYRGTTETDTSADGGTVTTETINGEEYTVHTFTSNGTYTPTASIALDYVYIIGGGAGGGGGGCGGLYGQGGGGGSSGGMVTLTNHSVTAGTGYSITRGSGGGGGSGNGGCDSDGNNGSGGGSSSAFGSSASGGNGASGGKTGGTTSGGSAPSGGNSGESGVWSSRGGCTSTTPARGGHGGHSPYDNTGRGTRGEGGCSVAGSAGSQYGAGGGGGQGGKCCGGGTGSGCSGGNGGTGANGAVIIKYKSSKAVEAGDLTLISNSVTADTTPTKGDLVILYDDTTGTATLNTDLKGFISRDGGTTYTEVTLSSEGNSNNYKVAVAHDVDISSQPSGTSMVYKITTVNQSDGVKETQVSAVSLGWS